MREIYFGDFRSYVIQHIRQIEKIDYDVDSLEWFLLKYLRRVVKATENENAPGRIEGCMRSLVRFYVDNLDERSELADQCIKIYNQYRLTLRHSQTR
ncbi:MAG: hypothetical protein ACI9SC_001935 [Gammaproteobacteria bacterium]|jgi:hypothetical protein